MDAEHGGYVNCNRHIDRYIGIFLVNFPLKNTVVCLQVLGDPEI